MKNWKLKNLKIENWKLNKPRKIGNRKIKKWKLKIASTLENQKLKNWIQIACGKLEIVKNQNDFDFDGIALNGWNWGIPSRGDAAADPQNKPKHQKINKKNSEKIFFSDLVMKQLNLFVFIKML